MDIIRWLVLSAILVAACTGAGAQHADFYVSPGGSDRWSGRLAASNDRRTDGPFGTVPRAQIAVRELLHSLGPGKARPILVQLRGGFYPLAAPLVFLPEDGGTPQTSVTYAAYPGEEPILSGGTRIEGWKADALGRWTVTLPEVQHGSWYFSQLWIDGQRRFRPRMPKKGYYTIMADVPPSPAAQGKGYDRFQFRPGDMRGTWSNQSDIEALCFQTWSMARMRVAAIDAHDENVVTFTGHTAALDPWAALPKGNRYLLENVKEALSEPGEWYLDRPTGELTYIPMPGERIDHAEIIAPRLDHLIELRGDPERQAASVEYLLSRPALPAHQLGHAARGPRLPAGRGGSRRRDNGCRRIRLPVLRLRYRAHRRLGGGVGRGLPAQYRDRLRVDRSRCGRGQNRRDDAASE